MKNRFIVLVLSTTAGLLSPHDQAVALRFVDAQGQEMPVITTSDPHPVVTLDPVTRAAVTPLDDIGKARIRLSGTVTDALADIVPGHLADITSVKIGEQSVPVQRVPVTASPTRPYAFRGRFAATIVTTDDTILVEAINIIGNREWDLVDLEYDIRLREADILYTGHDPIAKFLDPFTIRFESTVPGAARRLTLFQGLQADGKTTAQLTETGQGSGRFESDGPSRGAVTLRIDSMMTERGPNGSRAFQATFSSDALLIHEQESDFVETSADSGVFLSPSYRLPSNEVLEIRAPLRDAGLPGDLVFARVGAWEAFAAEDARARYGVVPRELRGAAPVIESRLARRAAGIYSSSTTALGAITLQLLEVQTDRIEVLVTSDRWRLNQLRLVLEGDRGIWRSRAHAPDKVEVRPFTLSAKLVGVKNVIPEGRPLGTPLAPVWVVVDGARVGVPGDYVTVGARRFDLAHVAMSGRTAPPVGVKAPFVFTARRPVIDLPNVWWALTEDKGGLRLIEFAAYVGGVRRATAVRGPLVFGR